MASGISAGSLADKFRRAFRNQTGSSFSHDELMALAEFGALHLLARLEADELIASKRPAGEQPEAISMPVMFSVRTLADRWQCSEGLVRKMIASGELASFRYGNLIRIKAEAVTEVEARRGERGR